MSKPRLLVATAAGAAALAIGVGGALAAGTPHHHHHHHHKKGGSCKYPSLSPGLGSVTGNVTCSKPAGKGTATITFSPSPSPPNVTNTGTFSDKFKKGTISGTYKITGALIPPGPETGKFKITKGTGSLKSAHGSGKMTCQITLILPVPMSCTQKLTRGGL